MTLLHAKFKLKPSIILMEIFLFIHIGAIFCVLFTHIFWWAKTLLTTCILTNLLVVIRHYVLSQGNNSIIEFWPDTGGGWYLKKRSSELVSAAISYPVFISDFLMVLIFVTKNKWLKISLPIGRDALMSDDIRKLKMLLRTERLPQ